MVNKSAEMAKKLIGRKVEVAPWWAKNWQEHTFSGTLKDVKRMRMTSYNVEKHRRQRLADDFQIVLKPDKKTKKWLKDIAVLRRKEGLFKPLLSGHKIRGQQILRR